MKCVEMLLLFEAVQDRAGECVRGSERAGIKELVPTTIPYLSWKIDARLSVTTLFVHLQSHAAHVLT